jgi:hypothetical protein
MQCVRVTLLLLCGFSYGALAQGIGKPQAHTPKMPPIQDKRAAAVAKQASKDAAKSDPKTRAQMQELNKKMSERTIANKSPQPSAPKATKAMDAYRK